MSSFQPPPPLPSDDEGDDEDEEADANRPRSKTRLTKEELVRYQEKLDEQCHFAPSKIAERVKLACSLAFNYASRNGLLDEYFAESERRKERERVSREEMGINGGASARWAAIPDGEVRRSSRARNTVNYADDGAQNVENILNEHEGIGKPVGSVGGSSDFLRKDISGGPTALLLLDVLGFSKDGKPEGDEGKSSEEEEGEDPFFEPDPRHVIDQLGRKQKYLLPANIQDAICRNIDGDHIDTPKSLLDEELVDQAGSNTFISDLVCTSDDKDQDLPHFEPASFARCRFTTRIFIPESEEEEDDAAEEDPVAQKQAKAEARVAARKRKEERKKKRQVAEQKRNARLETLYRSKKAFELWRFRSIHGNGCTVWPSWNDRSKTILKDVFGMSRASSVSDFVASSAVQSMVDDAQNPQPIAESDAPVDQQKMTDEALAQSLAAAENTDGEPFAKRRRTTRRAAGGDEPVFYGSHQSMSREQLLSTLVRILRQAKPGSSSIMKLKQLVFATDFEASRGQVVEWRKLRSALGHLVFRMGRLGRLLVDVDGDSTCWDLLKEGALVKFELPPISKNEDNGVDKSLVPAAAPASADLMKKLTALENYVKTLHLTELSLRSALMKAIDKGGQSGESLLQISTVAIATAADEVEGDAGAEDWNFFNSDEISWNSDDHMLIGQVIFRPSCSPILSSDAKPEYGQKCQWYKVVSFTPSVKGEEANIAEEAKQSQDPNAFEPNPVVERRMRFRAVPIAIGDDTKMHVQDASGVEQIILTESQVRAVRHCMTIVALQS